MKNLTTVDNDLHEVRDYRFDYAVRRTNLTKNRSCFSRDLSIDRKLLHLQRGTSGDPSGCVSTGDEAHR